MTKQPIRCVVVDFDLTIFDYARPQDTALIVPWFEELAARGIKVGIASGRSIGSLKHEIESLGLAWGQPFPAFAIEYECLIRDNNGATLSGTEAWNDSVLQETETLEREALPLLNKIREDALSEGVEIVRDILVEPGNVTICLETPLKTEEARVRLMTWLQRTHSKLEVRRNHHILIVAVAGRNKGSAVRQLQLAWELAPEQMLVIGDSLNDVPMMAPNLGFRCATVANADAQMITHVRNREGFVATAPAVHGTMQIFAELFEELNPVSNAAVVG